VEYECFFTTSKKNAQLILTSNIPSPTQKHTLW
jgi:hypothetical protein